MEVLGIDIGGSGMKAAVVDVKEGRLVSDRLRRATPQPPTRQAMHAVLDELVGEFAWKGPVGCGFPGVMRENVIYTAVNLEQSLIGWNIGEAITGLTGGPTFVLNDADAAGLAEVGLGAAKDRGGVVIVITVGTGIGTALFTGGRLVPNTELGHLEMAGKDVETEVSDVARKSNDLSWKQWAKKFDAYLWYLERLFSPELFVLGGGGAKKPEKYEEYLTVKTPHVPAHFRNKAGIVGAALSAAPLAATVSELQAGSSR